MANPMELTADQIAEHVFKAEIDVASAGRTRLFYSLRIQAYRVVHDGDTVQVIASPARAAEVFNATVRKHA